MLFRSSLEKGSIEKVPRKSRTYFSLVLMLLLSLAPLLVLDYGWHAEVNWHERQQAHSRVEQARQTLDSLETSHSFEYHLSRACGKFRRQILDIAKVEHTSFPYTKLIESTFKHPFPRTQVWIFDASSKKAKAVHTPKRAKFGKRAMSMIFQNFFDRYYGKVSSDRDNRQAAKLVKQVFGPGMDLPALTFGRHNQTTKMIFQGKIHYFFWSSWSLSPCCQGGCLFLSKKIWHQKGLG